MTVSQMHGLFIKFSLIIIVIAEIHVSKLKFIKSYLLSTVSLEILNEVAFLSIEKDLIDKLDRSYLSGKNSRE